MLVCADCGVEAEEGVRGWRAFLTGDETEPGYVDVFCPECAREEFGDV